MVELSQSLSDMPARRAAASALSRTDGSMPSTLHDTREFMLSSGSDFGAPPAPSASPRVPGERQSNSAQVVCLWHRLFRVTVNNGLRIRPAGRRKLPLALEIERGAVLRRPADRLRLRSAELADCCAAIFSPKRGRRPAERTPCRSTKPPWKTSISCSTTCFRSTATTIFPASATPPPTCGRRFWARLRSSAKRCCSRSIVSAISRAAPAMTMAA